MDNGHVLAPASYERALLLEAVTLLTQSQAETENTLSEQLAHTTRRMATLELRCDEFESRLTSIDERLARLAAEIQPPPDPDIEHRLTLLRTQVLLLRGRTHSQQQQISSSGPGWAPPDARLPRLEPLSNATFPPPAGVGPSGPTSSVSPAALAAAPLTSGSVDPGGAPGAAGSAAAPTPNVWEYLGTTPQDRAGVVLIGLGLIAVLYAVLVQFHLG